MTPETRSAIIALSRFLATAPGRRAAELVDGGEQTFVPAHEGESIDSVLTRLFRYDPPVFVAVYYPKRSGKSQMTLLKLEPTAGVAPIVGRQVGRTSTIGMLADSLTKDRENIQFVWTDSRSFAYTAGLQNVLG